MKIRFKFIAATSLIVAFSLLFSSTVFTVDNKNTINERKPKEGFNETVENVSGSIEQEEADLLYHKLTSDILISRKNNQQSIFDLLGTEISTSKSLETVNNIRSGEDYVRFTLNNGGSLGYDEYLGIVNVKNFRRNSEILHEKSLDAVIETISRDLALKDYTITESGLYQEQQNYYRIVWQKTVAGEAQSNPYDSVWVLLDSETYQLLYLERYSLDPNATTATISEEDALRIASPYFTFPDSFISEDSLEIDIKLTYVKENSLDVSEQQTQDSTVILAYVLKNDYARVKVDAINRNIDNAKQMCYVKYNQSDRYSPYLKLREGEGNFFDERVWCNE